MPKLSAASAIYVLANYHKPIDVEQTSICNNSRFQHYLAQKLQLGTTVLGEGEKFVFLRLKHGIKVIKQNSVQNPTIVGQVLSWKEFIISSRARSQQNLARGWQNALPGRYVCYFIRRSLIHTYPVLYSKICRHTQILCFL